MSHQTKKIVVVGAGFGGLTCILALEKKFKNNREISLTLVDKNEYHLFTPNLYEVATAEEEFTSARQFKKSIALPIKEIIAKTKIKFVLGALLEVDQKQKTITAGKKILEYDYLILALGSTSDDFGISGASEFGLPLKNLADALRIRNELEFMVQLHRQDAVKRTLRVVVGGGGYTGVEFAGELASMLDIIAWKNSYPREKIELEIIELSNNLISGFSPRLSEDAFFRLKDLGVNIRLNSRIVEVEKNFIELLSGDRVTYDLLIWTMGVKATPAPFKHAVAKDKKGRVGTNGYLQITGNEDIFVIGDESCILDEQGAPVASTAQDAIHQARYLASALPRIIKNQRPSGYSCLKHGFIVPIGGKWAILSSGSWYVKGFFADVIHQFAHFRYYRSLVGFSKAMKYIWREAEVYGRND